MIFGAGAIGGGIGGLMAEAHHDVTFVARGAHLEALRDAGLRLRSLADRIGPQPEEILGGSHAVPDVLVGHFAARAGYTRSMENVDVAALNASCAVP